MVSEKFITPEQRHDCETYERSFWIDLRHCSAWQVTDWRVGRWGWTIRNAAQDAIRRRENAIGDVTSLGIADSHDEAPDRVTWPEFVASHRGTLAEACASRIRHLAGREYVVWLVARWFAGEGAPPDVAAACEMMAVFEPSGAGIKTLEKQADQYLAHLAGQYNHWEPETP